jgi:hypothetical protein
MPTVSPEIRPINSTSYVDVVGLYLGVQRLPGEDSVLFLDRMYRAAAVRRDHTFEGAVNELNLDLGLKVQVGIRLNHSAGAGLLVTSDLRGLRVFHAGTALDTTVAIGASASDDVWEWRMLSEVVADLNAIPNITASLLIDDAPAVQLIRQSNLQTVLNEQVGRAHVRLAHGNILDGSLRLSRDVSSYTLDLATGDLVFSSGSVPPSMTVCYQFLTQPYDVVCSEGALFGLLDRDVSSAFLNGRHVIQQVREVVQEVMSQDRSYWAK